MWLQTDAFLCFLSINLTYRICELPQWLQLLYLFLHLIVVPLELEAKTRMQCCKSLQKCHRFSTHHLAHRLIILFTAELSIPIHKMCSEIADAKLYFFSSVKTNVNFCSNKIRSTSMIAVDNVLYLVEQLYLPLYSSSNSVIEPPYFHFAATLPPL